MNSKLIYSPKEDIPMGVVCFGSGSGTTIEAIIAEQRRQEVLGKPLFQVQAIVVNKKCRCIDIGEKERIPVIYNSKMRFFKERGKPGSDPETLVEYDKKNLGDLHALADKEGFEIDIIALAGYWSMVSKGLLDSYPDRIINSHPADLSILDRGNNRIYAGVYGANAAYKALVEGDDHTKTCIHLIDEGLDTGEILVTSEALPFFDEVDAVMKSRYVRGRSTQMAANAAKESALQAISIYHQELQKIRCDYPAYITALNLIAKGMLSIAGECKPRTIMLDGIRELPYQGYDLAEWNS